MSVFLNIPVANGVTTVDMTPGAAGNLEVLLLAPNPPTAGTVTIDGLPYGKSAYVRIGGATSLPLSSLASGGKLLVTDFNHYSALRFTLAGVVGGSGAIVGTAGLSAVTGVPPAPPQGYVRSIRNRTTRAIPNSARSFTCKCTSRRSRPARQLVLGSRPAPFLCSSRIGK